MKTFKLGLSTQSYSAKAPAPAASRQLARSQLVPRRFRPIALAAMMLSCGFTLLTTSPVLALALNQPTALAPHLTITQTDVQNMRQAILQPGRYQQSYLQQKQRLDQDMLRPMALPLPVDAGGGVSHEQHKLNYRLLYEAGLMYQLSGETRYADFVRTLLLGYSKLYPTLPVHPKATSSNKGKLFWQGLNDAVWLVYSIQAYDLVRAALSPDERQHIENNLLRPYARFLAEGSSETFNKIHNHGTWSTAAVGMTGYVLADQSMVDQALLGLDKSGKGGFLRQVDELFSPEGYYSEGPYYQRYALLPFVTFAQAIALNEPKRHIFERRNAVLLKAIHTTIQLSYNQLFFPINDAIKDKSIATSELVQAVALAYRLTADPRLLDIAQQQQQTLLTADGLAVAQALDAGLSQPYAFASKVYGDGQSGKEGALVILRWPFVSDNLPQPTTLHSTMHTTVHNTLAAAAAAATDHSTTASPTDAGMALLFKATAQGMGHGHFDKLHWSFYDGGAEIISDYGAARFLNVEAKAGGRYLPENESYAKQTVAHNTLVVDEQSHFNLQLKTAEQHHPTLQFVSLTPALQLVSATMQGAYADVQFTRTMALIDSKLVARPLAVDLLAVAAEKTHQYDLPLHYNGQFISSNFAYQRPATLAALGKKNGYQHFWQQATASPKQPLSQVTFLNDNHRFYTYSSLLSEDSQMLFVQLGANDPDFNLRTQTALIQRQAKAQQFQFVNVLESHGEYNANQEYTTAAQSQIKALRWLPPVASAKAAALTLLEIELTSGAHLVLAYQPAAADLAVNLQDAAATSTQQSNPPAAAASHSFQFQGQTFSFQGRAHLFEFPAQKAQP